MKKRIKRQGMMVVLAVAAMFVLYKATLPRWGSEWPDEVLDIIGIAVILVGFLFRISGRGYKQEQTRNGHELVMGGPYALVRNPMYFGTLLVGAGVVMVVAVWWVFLVFLSVYLFIYIPQIRMEEAALTERFGKKYTDYCAVTGRFFPKIRYLFFPRRYLPLKLPWIRRELPSLIPVLLSIVVIELWQDVALFGSQEFIREVLEIVSIVGIGLLVILLFSRVRKK